jgi:tRNA-specific 2-thiouridylase
VLRLEPERNALIVGPGDHLLRDNCTLHAVTFTAGTAPSTTFNATAQIRYRAIPVPVEVTLLDDDRAQVAFATPQRSVTPGQSLVFYRGDVVLGGGSIQP